MGGTTTTTTDATMAALEMRVGGGIFRYPIATVVLQVRDFFSIFTTMTTGGSIERAPAIVV
jgi:hypothetical protein